MNIVLILFTSQVSSEEDAEQVIREMHHFYTDPTRRLTVRLVLHTALSGKVVNLELKNLILL